MKKTRKITTPAEWQDAEKTLKRGLNACPIDERQHRELSIRGVQPVEGDENVFEVSFSSEAPVRRWFGKEILSHGTDAKVDLSPLVNVGSVLFNHDMDRPVAIPVEPRIDTAKKRGVARIRFVPEDPESADMKAKVLAGLVRGISVGYSVQKYLMDEETDDVTAVEWRVHEISLVTVPADATVGVGRSAQRVSSTTEVPGASAAPVNPRQGATAMSIKLKDGREISLLEYEGMRALGQRIELADGTVIEAAVRITGEQLSPNVPPAPDANGKRAKAPAKVVEVETEDELAVRSQYPEDAGCDPVEIKRRHDIRQFVQLARAGEFKDLFPVGVESSFIIGRMDESGKFVVPTSAEVRESIARMEASARKAKHGKENDNDSIVGRVTGGESRAVASLVDAIPQAVLMRGGVIDHGGRVKATGKVLSLRGAEEKLAERAPQLSQLSIVEMAREFLEAHGHECRGRGKREILTMAMGTLGRAVVNTQGSFSTLLENALNKTMLISYEAAPVTWRDFCVSIPANDLRAHPLYKKGVFGTLPIVGDGGEVPAMTFPDGKKETLTPAEFAGTFLLSEAILLNDDMNAFTSIIAEMGQSAAYTVEDWVYYRLLSNPTMAETGGALFNATAITTAGGHNNLTTGSATPSETTYQGMITKMSKQVAPDGSGTGKGRLLNLMPAIALGPPELGATLAKLYNDMVKLGGTNGESNVYKGLAKPVVNARLSSGVTVKDKAGALLSANGSTTAWNLLADPRIMPTVAVAFLNGNESPEFMEAMPIDVLGRQYRVVMRFGTAIAEWRGAQKHAGA